MYLFIICLNSVVTQPIRGGGKELNAISVNQTKMCGSDAEFPLFYVSQYFVSLGYGTNESDRI